MSVHHPHDRFFRESFSKPQVIRSFLDEYLPQTILDQIDLDTLELQSGSYVDDELRVHQTDLLYRVQIVTGGALWLYFLFDHKSAPDRWVGLQLLRYMVQIWEKNRPKRKDQFLIPILPLVIYHGEQRWNLSAEFHALFDKLPTSLQSHIPKFSYKLFDFSHRSDVEIRGELWSRITLLTLRAIFDPRLHELLPKLVRLIFQLNEQKTGLEYIYTILYYLSVATDKVDLDTMKQVLLTQGEQGVEAMATLAQQWIEEGIERGIEQGIEQGIERGKQRERLEMARRLLRLHDVVTVSELTKLSIEEVTQLTNEQA